MRETIKALAIMLALFALPIAFAVVGTMPAHANNAALELALMTPTLGPAFEDSWSVDCGPTATPISSPDGYAMLSYSAQLPLPGEANAGVLVAFGDSAIADPDISTRNSQAITGTLLAGGTVKGDARKSYCRADVGTVKIYIRALVATLSAP